MKHQHQVAAILIVGSLFIYFVNVGAQQRVCESEPTNETCTLEWKPICGCDCMNYGNECQMKNQGRYHKDVLRFRLQHLSTMYFNLGTKMKSRKGAEAKQRRFLT
ncbi:unnamed protein product [Orchesella dallaii]|uniref:Kazal-like domain-containing protein n=1 Tax=Orchesella dallaii TaxID=48710 RepID=A0ABP1R8A0_9HEXA